MKKIALILIMLFLLASCATPTPVPTPIPTLVPSPEPTATPETGITERLADSVSLLQGVGYTSLFEGVLMGMNVNPETSEITYSVYSIPGLPWELVGNGTGKFEAGKIFYLTDTAKCKMAPEATYEFYIIREDGIITGIKQKLVGSDSCAERKTMNSGNSLIYFTGTTPVIDGTERPPIASPEIFGIWYSRDGMMIGFTGSINFDTGKALITSYFYNTRVDPWVLVDTIEASMSKEGTLIFKSATGTCAANPNATYEISMITRDDKVIGLHSRLTGEDLCADRKKIFDDQVLVHVNR